MPMIAIDLLDISDKLSKISVPGDKISEGYHVTMFYFEGKLKIEDIFDIAKTTFNLIKSVGPINIKLKTVSCFKRGFPNDDDLVPIVIPVISDELLELRSKIAKKFDKDHIEYSKKFPDYHPHTTLSYSKNEIEDKKIETISYKANNIVFYSGNEMDDGINIVLPLSLSKKAFQYSWNYFVAEKFEQLVKI